MKAPPINNIFDWLNNSSAVAKDGSGLLADHVQQRATELELINLDLTSRMEEMHKMRELHRVLLDAMPNPAWLISHDRRILAQNKAGALLGAAIGDYCWNSIHNGKTITPDEKNAYLSGSQQHLPIHCYFCHADEVMKSGQQITSEIELDGVFWDVGWIPVDDATFLHYAVDVTKKHQEREALVCSEKKYHDLFTNLVEGFASHEMIFDSNGVPCDYRFIEVNPAFEKMTGLHAAHIVGKTVLQVLPNTEARWIEIYGRVVTTGEPVRLEEYSRELDRWYEVVAYSTTPGQFAVITSDITERIRISEQLRQSQKMESIGTLAGGVAHDFNNIMTVIMGAAALLRVKLGNDEVLGPVIGQILSSSERAAQLTQDLLAFSRKQTIKQLPVDLNEVVSTMQGFLRHVISEDVLLETELSATKLIANVDRGHIEQVLMNLAVNSRDAMPTGGTLRIVTARVDVRDNPLDLANLPAGRYARISVTDSGVGMDELTRVRIFEPFFTTKAIGNGTGLGLSIAHGIVRQHNGIISVLSQPDEGTTFNVYLPLVESEPDEISVTARPPLPGGDETILLVEDDDAVRRSITATLKAVGYTVHAAAHGEEALALYTQYGSSIALVILDVIMPKMNGREVCEQLKGIRPDVKVLFASGYAAQYLQSKGILSGTVDFISKPLDPFRFLTKVRELISL